MEEKKGSQTLLSLYPTLRANFQRFETIKLSWWCREDITVIMFNSHFVLSVGNHWICCYSGLLCNMQKCKCIKSMVPRYVGHLESKERLRIQPAQLFNFGMHSTILHTVRTWHHRTFTSSWTWRSTLLVNDMQMMRTCSRLSWTGWIARRSSGTRRE